MTIRSGFKYRIYPNRGQQQQLAVQFGHCRFVYNRYRAMREATFQETGQGLSYQECAPDLTRLKKEPEYTWLREADSQALQQSLRVLGKLRWQAVIAQDFGLFLLEQGQSREAEAHIREGLELAATLSSQADVLAGTAADGPLAGPKRPFCGGDGCRRLH
jgi:hypothetical protein